MPSRMADRKTYTSGGLGFRVKGGTFQGGLWQFMGDVWSLGVPKIWGSLRRVYKGYMKTRGTILGGGYQFKGQ